MNPQPDGVQIVQASDAQWPLALALLPELLGCERLPQVLWVAHLPGQPQRLVAAAGLVTAPRDRRRSGFRGLVRVLPAFQRQGLGRALVARLADQLRSWDLDHLHGWTAYGPGPTDSFLAACGFAPLRQVHHFHALCARTRPLLQAWVARLRAHRRVPAGLRLLDFADAFGGALRAPVAGLYAAHFGLSPAAADAAIAHRLATPGVAGLSVALRDDDGPQARIAGFLLADLKDGAPAVDLWLVDPDRRHGTEALLLLDAFVQRLDDAGHAGAAFHCHDETGATLGVARRIGAEATGLQQTRALAVGSAAVDSAGTVAGPASEAAA